tara:strand:+ start:186 stop:539 length:354 start_codon:yes stop_codon:yes gene_type:complete
MSIQFFGDLTLERETEKLWNEITEGGVCTFNGNEVSILDVMQEVEDEAICMLRDLSFVYLLAGDNAQALKLAEQMFEEQLLLVFNDKDVKEHIAQEFKKDGLDIKYRNTDENDYTYY